MQRENMNQSLNIAKKGTQTPPKLDLAQRLFMYHMRLCYLFNELTMNRTWFNRLSICELINAAM